MRTTKSTRPERNSNPPAECPQERRWSSVERCSGFGKAPLGQDVLTLVTGHHGHELLRKRWLRRVLQHRYGIHVHRAGGLGKVDGRDLASGAAGIGDVH